MLLAFLVAHMVAVWLLMYFVGEEPEFERLPTFIYWYATTASTIGYGDVSPKTDVGRLINAFFVYPGAIAVFTGIITKAIAGASDRLRRTRVGLGDYRKMTHAIVLVGYDDVRTPRMITELCADAEPGQELILLTTKEFDNRDARIRYVRASSLTSPADLERAGVPDADRVIIFAGSDNDTLAAGLAIASLNHRGHIVCYFEDEATARLLTAHCPNVDAVLAPAVELVVQGGQGPGREPAARRPGQPHRRGHDPVQHGLARRRPLLPRPGDAAARPRRRTGRLPDGRRRRLPICRRRGRARRPLLLRRRAAAAARAAGGRGLMFGSTSALPAVEGVTIGRTVSLDPRAWQRYGDETYFALDRYELTITAQGLIRLDDGSHLHRFYTDEEIMLQAVSRRAGRPRRL